MIKRYFYIFSTTLFILLSPTTGIKAETLEKRLHAIERLQKAPPGFNYQAAVRDAEGEILANAEVILQFSIQTATDGGTVHWVETHTVATNAQGLVSLVIGEGTRVDGTQTIFDAIPFGDSDMFLKVEANTGTGFTTMGTEQLQSVPYAMVAENGLSTAQITKLDALDTNAEQNIQADWNETDTNSDAFIQNKPNISGGGSVQADWAVTDTNSDAYIANKPDLSNFDQNAADDFDGAFGSLTGVPANLDTDATDDFDGAFGSLTGVPANLDTDATDDFDGAFGSLTGVPVNLDSDATDDFDGAFGSLTGVPANLDTDATDDLTITDLAFTTADNLTSNGNGDLANDSFLFGSTSMDDNGFLPHDRRMFFDKSSGAFRVGRVTSDQWNYSNRGSVSFASGEDNIASGSRSTAIGGNDNTASGNNSSVLGGQSLTAESFAQITIGLFNTEHPGSPNAASSVFSDRLVVVGNGTSNASRSDALVMLKNGNTTLNGQLTLSDGANPVTLPNSDGANGQVLSTDGNGNIGWANDATGGAFTTAANLTSNSNGDLVNDSFLFGSTSMDDIAGTDDNNRMFFDKSTGAFRVGQAQGTQWDTPGVQSFAVGRSNTVMGLRSSALGGQSNNVLGAQNVIAAGSNNSINSGSNAIISAGDHNELSGNGSFIGAGSYNNMDGGVESFIGAGYSNHITSDHGFIGGGYNNNMTSSGLSGSIGGGKNNSVQAYYATVPGGLGLRADSFSQISMGLYNTFHPAGVSTTTRVPTNRLLVVGNGTSNASRSDALVMLKNGDTDINGALVANSLGVDGQFTLPTTDGPGNYVMQTDGIGGISWQDPMVISSDKRLKTNIRDISNVFEKLSRIEGYRFNWNEVQNRDTEREEIGFIAQEVQKLYPELVSLDDQGYLRVKYISFVPLLLEAVKELEERNAKLAAENNTLEERQSKDEERFAKLEGQLKLLMQQMLPAENVGKD